MPKFSVRTETDLSPDDVWAAITEFGDVRPTLWPFIAPSLYKVYSVEDGAADVQEGTKMPGGAVWAREHYTWDDTKRELHGTVAESNIFKIGGTCRMVVTERPGGGAIMEEHYDRERIGFKGKVMNLIMSGDKVGKFLAKARVKTFDAIRDWDDRPSVKQPAMSGATSE